MIKLSGEQFSEDLFVGHIEVGGTVRADIRARSFEDFAVEMMAAYLRLIGVAKADPPPETEQPKPVGTDIAYSETVEKPPQAIREDELRAAPAPRRDTEPRVPRRR